MLGDDVTQLQPQLMLALAFYTSEAVFIDYNGQQAGSLAPTALELEIRDEFFSMGRFELEVATVYLQYQSKENQLSSVYFYLYQYIFKPVQIINQVTKVERRWQVLFPPK